MKDAIGYSEMMNSWNRETLLEKAEMVGEDTLDKWVEKVVTEEFTKYPEPVSALSVIKRYQTVT
jgi:hypothetical protein